MKKTMKRTKIMYILMLGDSCSGKTVLIHRYEDGTFREHTLATMGSDFIIKDVKICNNQKEEKIKVKILDSIGIERFRNTCLTQIKNTNGIMLLFDVTSEHMFSNLSNWINDINNIKENIPIIIVGNMINIEEKRSIFLEDAVFFAWENHIKYFETSSKSGIGVDEAYTYLITKTFNQIKNEDSHEELNNNKINLDSSSHNCDLSTKDLKSLLKNLENENDYSHMIKKINEIENFLEKMKSTKCDIDYQKYFTILFKKVNCIKDKESQLTSHINIYFQLLTCFSELPSLKLFLTKFNNNHEIIDLIHSLKNYTSKEKFYRLYTNNYSILSKLKMIDLVKIYDSLLYSSLKSNESFIELQVFLSNIVISIYEIIKESTQNDTINNLFIVELLVSFGDILVINITNIIVTNQKNIELLQTLFERTKRLFEMYYEMQKLYNNVVIDLLYKIQCVFCLFCSSCKTDICYYDILEYIYSFIEKYSKLLYPFFINLLYSTNQYKNSSTVMFCKFTKKLYQPYYNLNFQKENNPNYFEENNIESNYVQILSSMPFIGKNIVIGNLSIIKYIYRKNRLTHYLAHTFGELPFIIINSFYYIIQKEINDNDINDFIEIEIIKILKHITDIKSYHFFYVEWKKVLEILFTITRNLMKKSILYFRECILCALPIIQTLFQYNSYVKRNHHIIINYLLLLSQKEINREFSLFIYLFSFCQKCVLQHCYDFLKPFLIYGFDSSFYFQRKTNADLTKEEQVINIILDIVNMGNQPVIQKIKIYFFEQYSRIFDCLCGNRKVINENFIKITSILFNFSNENYQEYLKKIFKIELEQNINYYYSFQLDGLINKTNTFLSIYKRLLFLLNNKKKQQEFIYLIKLTLSQRVYNDNNTEKKGAQYKTASLVNYLIEYLNIDKEGKIFFSSIPDKEDNCYCALVNNKNNEYYYIDFESIISNYIYHLGLWYNYPQITEYYDKYDHKWNSFELNEIEKDFIFYILEVALNDIYLLSNNNILQILSIYIRIFNNNEPLSTIQSIVNFFVKCNNLFNYKVSTYYFNTLEEQTNEVYFVSDKTMGIKERILTKVLELINSSSLEMSKDYYQYRSVIFLLNSTLEKPLSPDYYINHSNLSITRLFQIISTLMNEKYDVLKYFYLLILLFMLKEIVSYFDTSKLFTIIYYLLIIGRPSHSEEIFCLFQTFMSNKIKQISIQLQMSQKSSFYFYDFCDKVCLLYLKVLNQREGDEKIKRFFSQLKLFFIKLNKTKRDNVFLLMLNNILQKKEGKSNIDEISIKNSIDKYNIYYQNNILLCIDNNNIIEISISSYFYYSISIAKKIENIVTNNENKKNIISNLYNIRDKSIDEKECNTINQNKDAQVDNMNDIDFTIQYGEKKDNFIVKQTICSLLEIPIHITYYVNIFYYSKYYDELTLPFLLQEVEPDEINPTFFTFISQIGNIYVNNNNEKELSYKDELYHIIFKFVNLESNEEDKIKAIQNSQVNIIWIDNEFINIDKVETIFDSIQSNLYTNITITPKLSTHCLVRMKKLTYTNNNDSKDITIDDFLCDNYFININTLSSIRYLIKSIIILCDWNYYFQTKKIEFKEQDNKETEDTRTNCFYKRFDLIEEISKT